MTDIVMAFILWCVIIPLCFVGLSNFNLWFYGKIKQ